MSAKFLKLLSRHIFQGIADQMNNTALDDDIGKNSLCAVFKSRKSVHADKADFLNSTRFYLIENLHPKMFALSVLNPQPQNILFPVFVISQNIINGAISAIIIAANIDIKTVNENEWIKRLEGAILPVSLLFKHAIRYF